MFHNEDTKRLERLTVIRRGFDKFCQRVSFDEDGVSRLESAMRIGLYNINLTCEDMDQCVIGNKLFLLDCLIRSHGAKYIIMVVTYGLNVHACLKSCAVSKVTFIKACILSGEYREEGFVSQEIIFSVLILDHYGTPTPKE
jgi:hypothetical protein